MEKSDRKLDKCGGFIMFFKGKGDCPPCVRRNEGDVWFLGVGRNVRLLGAILTTAFI